MLKITIAQVNSTVGDLAGNAGKVLSAFRDAEKMASDLIVFPELTLTGYPPEDLLFRKEFIDAGLKTFRAIIQKTHGARTALVFGYVDRDARERLFNAAAAVQNGKILAVHHKIELPNYGVFDEKRYFTPGERPTFFELKGRRIGLSICEDIWIPDGRFFREDTRNACAALLNLSASPYHRGKQNVRYGIARRMARHAHAPIVYANLVGGQDELVFDGRSFVANASGRIVYEAAPFEESRHTFAVPLKKGASKKFHMKEPDSDREVYEALVLGTGDYVRKNHFRKVLVGLSGGIDSAIVACIAADALGPQNVIGVTMPSPYTSAATYNDAKKLAANLGIACQEYRIDDVFQSYLMLFKDVFQGLPTNVTEENLQARIRGTLLMALSNKFGHIVLTTGNKSEYATGYCTLYGDMAGGFAVIKDVPKTLVMKLSRWRNKRFPKRSIPESILKRPPTAELRHNQTDQDTLPPYPLLDRFLESYIENDLPMKKIIRRGIPRKAAERIQRMVDHNEYKRRQAPPGIKITPKAFGRDRRMPITNRFRP